MTDWRAEATRAAWDVCDNEHHWDFPCSDCESRAGLFLAFAERYAEERVREEREACAHKADGWANSQSCGHHDDNPCCHIRTGVGIAAAIRARGGAPASAAMSARGEGA